MPNIEAILRQINKDLVPEFESKLRAYLADQDKEWLIEQVVRLIGQLDPKESTGDPLCSLELKQHC